MEKCFCCVEKHLNNISRFSYFWNVLYIVKYLSAWIKSCQSNSWSSISTKDENNLHNGLAHWPFPGKKILADRSNQEIYQIPSDLLKMSAGIVSACRSIVPPIKGSIGRKMAKIAALNLNDLLNGTCSRIKSGFKRWDGL